MSKAKPKDRSLKAVISVIEEEAAKIQSVENETFERLKKGSVKKAAPVAEDSC